jgi:type II secretory pathway pseudopilin PulG
MRFFDIGRRTAPLPRLRRGATLLELLTVIVVLMMITSVTIPVVAPHAEGRRIREGARMFSTFINAGRTRAIETGRPAGVWIERMSNLPEAANMAFFAEIPPVYCGDFLDSTVECCVVGKQTGATTWPNQSDQEYYNIVIPRNRSAYNTDVWSEPSADEDQSVGSHQLNRSLLLAPRYRRLRCARVRSKKMVVRRQGN